MLALAVAKLPHGAPWSYELKFDGYRAIGLKANGRVQLLSRNGKDFAKRFASITAALEMLPDDTVIDGEIVAFDANGRPSFNVLQNQRSKAPELRLFAFDLITHCGRDLIQQPQEKRREILRTQVMPRLPDLIRFSETLEATVSELMGAVREQGRRHSREAARQSLRVWQALGRLAKNARPPTSQPRGGGCTPGGRGFEAILVGYYEGRKLMYVAKGRGGFTPASRGLVFKQFRGLESEICPFENLPETRRGQWSEGLTAEDMLQCRWLKPHLKATIEYLEWTGANHLRLAAFAAILT
jgi:ATP-dependent DNA ligase